MNALIIEDEKSGRPQSDGSAFGGGPAYRGCSRIG